jgi:cell wall-associated NlpC family hydrolase
MRQVQATYRITPSTTTTLVQPVEIADDIIYVEDASALSEPNFATSYSNNISYNIGAVVIYDTSFYRAIAFTTGNLPTDTNYWEVTEGAANIWGILTVNGERILYRNRDTVTNTVSGLLRGTAGTAITTHNTGTYVYNMGRENLMPLGCQNYVVSNITNPLESGVNLGDGTTTEFVASDISLVIAGATAWVVSNTYASGAAVVNSSNYYRAIIAVPANTAITNTTYWEPMSNAVEVYVGGARILNTDYTMTSQNPVTIEFDTAPPVGAEVAILVKRAHTWYNVDTPNLPLNETDTICARFLQGQ